MPNPTEENSTAITSQAVDKPLVPIAPSIIPTHVPDDLSGTEFFLTTEHLYSEEAQKEFEKSDEYWREKDLLLAQGQAWENQKGAAAYVSLSQCRPGLVESAKQMIGRKTSGRVRDPIDQPAGRRRQQQRQQR
jgi:hypothetical protein